MVLKDIAMFHNRHRRQPLFKCCNDLNRIKPPVPSTTTDVKEKHSATVCAGSDTGSSDKYVPRSAIILDPSTASRRLSRPKYYRHQSFPCASTTTSDYEHQRTPNIAIKVIGDNETGVLNDDEAAYGRNSVLPYRSALDIDEPETFYCLNVSFYQPITQPKHNHEVSLLSMHHIVDFNNLQMLR